MGIAENVCAEGVDHKRKWFSDKVFMITEDRKGAQRKC